MSINEANLTAIRATAGAVDVPMNAVGITFFVDGNNRFIITENLNGCTGVAIISAYACILAHIWPRPPNDPSQSAGDQNVVRMMQQVNELYQQHRVYFPTSQGVIAVAFFDGEQALPTQIEIIGQVLAAMEIPFQTAAYNVLRQHEGRGALKGTLIVGGQRGQAPSVIIEGTVQAAT